MFYASFADECDAARMGLKSEKPATLKGSFGMACTAMRPAAALDLPAPTIEAKKQTPEEARAARLKKAASNDGMMGGLFLEALCPGLSLLQVGGLSFGDTVDLYDEARALLRREKVPLAQRRQMPVLTQPAPQMAMPRIPARRTLMAPAFG